VTGTVTDASQAPVSRSRVMSGAEMSSTRAMAAGLFVMSWSAAASTSARAAVRPVANAVMRIVMRRGILPHQPRLPPVCRGGVAVISDQQRRPAG
jgi:hypothetical protein